MKIKYKKEELFKMNPIDVYNLVLEGKYIKVFPKGFWQRPEAIENSKILTKYLIEEKLNLNEVKIKEQLSANLFKRNNLGGMLECCFNSSPFKAVNTIYPDKFKPWEFKTVPTGFWILENGIEATKWLVEEKLKLTDEELKKQLSTNLFKDNDLGGMLYSCFNGSPYEAINTICPDKFKPWEFNYTSTNFWTLENGIKATKWLIEERLKITDEEIKEQLSTSLFKENGLGGMIRICFNYNIYKAINTAYPNKFKEWEFNKVSSGFWTLENGIKATKWLIEEKLKLSDEEIKKQLSVKLFKNNNLSGMLQTCFDDSPYKAINTVYPNKFKKSDFKGYN